MRNHLRWLFLFLFGIALIGCQDDLNVNNPVNNQEGSGFSLNKTSVAIETLTSDLILTGTGILTAGTGCEPDGTGTINLNVPFGYTINKVYLYWEGRHDITANPDGDNDLIINSNTVVGELIGKAAIAGPRVCYTHRADITGLGIVTTGNNVLNISGFDASGYPDLNRPNGAGVLVIYSEGSKDSKIEVRDGADFTFIIEGDPWTQNFTEKQTFVFPAASVDRIANMNIFVGDLGIEVGVFRPQYLVYRVGSGPEVKKTNPFFQSDGEKWDTYKLDIDIPAGANQLEVQIFSGPGGPSASPASICWVTAALSVPVTSLLAEVGDRIWKDVNKNGIQDTGEEGFPGVTVGLFKCDGTPANLVMNTDANGNYLFKDLEPGSYKVKMNIPDGWSLSPQNAGSDDAIDSDFDPAIDNKPYTDCFDLIAGESDLTWDGGLFLTAPKLNKIGDFVWHDKNVNGIQDNSEPGISGVKVELLSGNTVINSTTTDENGKYEFTGLSNGNYCVRVAASNYESGGVLFSTTQTKWYATKKNQGIDDSKDSDTGKNESVCVDLNNNDNLTLDFGFYKTCVSVTKLADKQTAKPGDKITYTFIVENCGDITLGGGVDLYDAMINPVAPHKIGNLTPVYPGTTKSLTKTYCVTSKDCGDLVNTVKAVGHPVDGSFNVEFTASVTVKIDCQKPSKLGDRVWLDKDKDGIQDYGESGIKNVKVQLYDCAGKLVATTSTNYYGIYYFSNLTPGDYKVKFYAPTGYGFTKKDQDSNDEKDSDIDPATGFTTCVTLGSGITDLKWDAGLICIPPSKLGDKVWLDKDKDGIQDHGEYGIKNVVVKLYDCNGNYIKSTTTNYDGNYYFSNLTPGDYKVKVHAPRGYAFTKQDHGTNDEKDSDFDPATGYTKSISLGIGINDYKWDAGLYCK